MEFIRVTEENLEKEHICCAISSNKDCQVVSKKRWLSKRFQEGLVFLKANVRGKCFIEYLPAEYAFAPVKADGYMYINCLWVAGQYKGQGYSSQLLEACIDDSRKKGCKGWQSCQRTRRGPTWLILSTCVTKDFRRRILRGHILNLCIFPLRKARMCHDSGNR